MDERRQTLGESRVRIKFNPSDNSLVSQIKQKTAELIDLCEDMKQPSVEKEFGTGKAGEIFRCIALAQTHYEDAAMWAVKAATA